MPCFLSINTVYLRKTINTSYETWNARVRSVSSSSGTHRDRVNKSMQLRKATAWMSLKAFSLWSSISSFRRKGIHQPKDTSVNTGAFAGSDGPWVFTLQLQRPLHNVGDSLGMAQMQHLESPGWLPRRWSACWATRASIKAISACAVWPKLLGMFVHLWTEPAPFPSHCLLNIRNTLDRIWL